jgi:hypothetical protein
MDGIYVRRETAGGDTRHQILALHTTMIHRRRGDGNGLGALIRQVERLQGFP